MISPVRTLRQLAIRICHRPALLDDKTVTERQADLALGDWGGLLASGSRGAAWPVRMRDNGEWRWRYPSSTTGRRSAIVCDRSGQRNHAFIGHARCVRASAGRLISSALGMAGIGPALPAKIRRGFRDRLDRSSFGRARQSAAAVLLAPDPWASAPRREEYRFQVPEAPVVRAEAQWP